MVLQNFLGEQVVTIKVHRSELERIVDEASIIQKTTGSCLRAFKRCHTNLRGHMGHNDDSKNYTSLTHWLFTNCGTDSLQIAFQSIHQTKNHNIYVVYLIYTQVLLQQVDVKQYHVFHN